jgi:hypothetical protein
MSQKKDLPDGVRVDRRIFLRNTGAAVLTLAPIGAARARAAERRSLSFVHTHTLPGFSTRTLHELARKMQRGGVGFYPRSDFVHLDNGAVRFW